MSRHGKTAPHCTLCGHAIDAANAHPLAHGVTSDCRPWPHPITLLSCPRCGLTQTHTDPQWLESTRRIYAAYDTYAAAGGAEQKVVGGSNASLRSRSDVLVDSLRNSLRLPACGQLLDIGCGAGAFLHAFNQTMPQWQLDGIEVDQRNLTRLAQVRGFRALHTSVASLPTNQYDIISLIHVLEHLESPVAYLRNLARHSTPQGFLVIQVPDCTQNPFALTIADHASHFNAATLEKVVRASGWEPVLPATNRIPKELTLVAQRSAVPAPDSFPLRLAGDRLHPQLADELRWLRSTEETAREIARNSRAFGLFGTAIASTWLYHAVSSHVRWFVDEDPDRIGRHHLGKAILSPTAIPSGADIFVGLAPVIGQRIVSRLRGARPDVGFHLGPSLHAP